MVSSVRSTKLELQRIPSMLPSMEYAAAEVGAKRHGTFISPTPPPARNMTRLGSFGCERMVRHEGAMPPWLGIAVRSRHSFADSVFAHMPLDETDDIALLLMLYALQSPLECHFSRLTAMPQPAIGGSPDEFFERRPDEFAHDFVYGRGDFVDDRDVPFTADGSDLVVLREGMVWLGGRSVSDALARAVVAVVAHRGSTSRGELDEATVRPRARPIQRDGELARQCPWLVNNMLADAPPTA